LELRKIHVELQRAPQPFARFLLVARAHQQIQRIRVIRKQVGRNVGADVSSGTGEENSHVIWSSA
jgi:hypothetical protein